MNAVINNPYRILGLPPSSNDKEIIKRVSDLVIYSEIGKDVRYDTDLEFIGLIIRSADNIKSAAKKLENNELKLFYSLMYFEIKDDIDKEALVLLKNKNYKGAIDILSESIFTYCPINYRRSKSIVNLLWDRKWENCKGPNFTIECIKQFLVPFPDLRITSYPDQNKIYFFQESLITIKGLNRYHVSLEFKFCPPTIGKRIIGLSLKCAESQQLNNILVDSSGILRFEKGNDKLDSEFITIAEISFSTSVLKEKNYLEIKKYNGCFEIWLNNQLIFSTASTVDYSSFCACFSGAQTIIVSGLALSELEHSKSYSLDIKLDDYTFHKVVNLSLIYLLMVTWNEAPVTSLIDYFDLASNFYKQEYLKKYSKNKIATNFEIDFSKLTDTYVREFYSEFKNRIDIYNLTSVLSFYSPFNHLSDEAEEKAMEVVIGSGIYKFEELIKNTSEQRTNKILDGKVLAENLIKSAASFFAWFSNFAGYKGGSFVNIYDKVAKELIDCAISFYNDNPKHNIQSVNDAISILKQASEFARNLENRDRIIKNINIITESNGLEQININFKYKDLNELLKSITKKDHKYNEPLPAKTVLQPNNKQQKRKPQIRILKILVPILIILILSYVAYDSIRDSDSVSKQKPVSGWAGNQLFNGSSPYENFFGQQVFDYNSSCWLNIKNGNQTDAVVCLEDVYSQRTIRNIYIRAGSSFTLENLPRGTFKVKTFHGNGWNPSKKLNDGKIIGGFESDIGFSVSDKMDDLITVDYNEYSYTTGEMTLYTVSNGNIQQRRINSNEFFN